MSSDARELKNAGGRQEVIWAMMASNADHSRGYTASWERRGEGEGRLPGGDDI